MENIESSNTLQVSLIINCINTEIVDVISKTLKPENKILADKTKIKMEKKSKTLRIEISSESTIMSLRTTIDDIFHTIQIVKKVYQTIQKHKT
jgi:tRNA threonylcarbamoyladenosine modification (KEOPS) complex  Pcc1 subunit